MRRILLLLILTWACKVSVFASHIVGGEFELLHLSDFQYRLNMLLYFDEINGNPGAKDPTVTVHIWRKSDNSLMRSVTLQMSEDSFVPYSNSDCDDGQLVTSRLVYTTVLTLSGDTYDDPDGYYVSWERCCRNYNITNIRSDDPGLGSGIAAGQTFYLEFPPVMRNGVQFVNSTPKLFPPLRDYGCVDKFYFVDFGGVDDDGDSLAYSLVTPYSTIEPSAIPANPNPQPYPDVVWEDGFGINNIMDGIPDLAISTDGLLTVTPKSKGLYVFAVKCEEFREGEKIGEMRRDFQMLVVGNCINSSPEIRAREVGESDFYDEGNVLAFSSGDDDKCIEILVTDQPVGGDLEENVTVRAIPINFDAELEDIEINFDENVPLTSELDTARFTVCFPDCPYTRNGIYKIGIIGYDDACPQPALDTVEVTLNVPPPPNENAYYANSKGASKFSKITRVVEESAGGSLTIPINAFDDDNDELTLSIEPLGFNLEPVGMSFTDPVFSAGEVHTTFSWNFDCNAEDLDLSSGRDVSSGNLIRKAFDILLTAEDLDFCEWEDPQTLLMTMIIEFPNQTKPRVYRQGQPSVDELSITHMVDNTLVIPIKADDADGDQVLLQGFGTDFTFGQLGASFENKQGGGVPGVISDFVLPADCQFDLSEINSFNAIFIVEDQDACQLTNLDTLSLQVNLVPPINTDLQLQFESLNELELENDTLSLTIGESIESQFSAVDFENDSLSLILNEVLPDVNGYEFNDVFTRGQVVAPFDWVPDCSTLKGESKVHYNFQFILSDNNCYSPKGDTVQFVVEINDIKVGQTDIKLPNFFSPDEFDDVNEFFGPYRQKSAESDELVNVLPIDNCAGQFQGVSVYNRWGRTVFESTSRDFKWFGESEPPGVYFYHVKYTNKDYKGWVQMMK